MQLGMVGLGRMGANIVRRLMRDGHEWWSTTSTPRRWRSSRARARRDRESLADFVAKLETPRAAWVMVPAAITGRVVDQLAELMEAGDIIIDGGNSYYRDDIDQGRAAVSAKGIHYVDVGTSGGVFGLERGYCLMIGGEDEIVAHLDPIFSTHRARRRDGAAHARPHGCQRQHRRERLPALRRRTAPATS